MLQIKTVIHSDSARPESTKASSCWVTGGYWIVFGFGAAVTRLSTHTGFLVEAVAVAVCEPATCVSAR